MKLSYFKNPNSKYTEQNFLEALTNFSSRSHGSSLGARPGDQIKSLFPQLSVDKPKSVSYTKYFLYLYGYKHCSTCKGVLKLSNFSKHKGSWDSYFSICKKCDSIRGKKYKDDHKDELKDSYKSWYEKNKHIRANYQALRRANKKQATPNWLTSELKKEILDTYLSAKLQGKTVDHIVPLKGKYVCGLHVPWNLQIIDNDENIKKSNYHYSEEYWR